jgi:hypothetical protein
VIKQTGETDDKKTDDEERVRSIFFHHIYKEEHQQEKKWYADLCKKEKKDRMNRLKKVVGVGYGKGALCIKIISESCPENGVLIDDDESVLNQFPSFREALRITFKNEK